MQDAMETAPKDREILITGPLGRGEHITEVIGFWLNGVWRGACGEGVLDPRSWREMDI